MLFDVITSIAVVVIVIGAMFYRMYKTPHKPEYDKL